MAVILDPVTYKGYWKITPDSSDTTIFYVVRKSEIYFKSTYANEGKICLNSDDDLSTPLVITAIDTMDNNGNAIGNSLAIAQYIVDNS